MISEDKTRKISHTVRYTTGECEGITVWLFCPGCKEIHAPRFRCPEHGGPKQGPVWQGDPYSEPFSMDPSLLVHMSDVNKCHSFIRQGQWEFLGDSTAHELRGFHPLAELPEWLLS